MGWVSGFPPNKGMVVRFRVTSSTILWLETEPHIAADVLIGARMCMIKQDK